MNAEDWFEDNDITGKLEDLVKELKSDNTSMVGDSKLDIFLKNIRKIVHTSYNFSDVTPLLVKTILDPDQGYSLNSLIEKSFYAVTSNGEYSLDKVEYREDNHKVVVDFKAELVD